MRDRRELRSFGLVLVVIATVCVTACISSCGSGGGGGGNDGTICNQCGDSDGLCVESQGVTGDDRPSFCLSPTERNPCVARLRCVRKLDSGQRRCFPADPVTNALDLAYRCDGSRPDPDVAPTTTATATATVTPTPTVTPSATGVTPTPTLTPSATGETPTPATTAGEPEPVDVTIKIVADVDENDDLPGNFTGTVTYPATKGNFLSSGEADCTPDEDAATATDNGSGTLTITFSGDSEDVTSVETSCVFHQAAGQTLTNGDLGKSVTDSLIITIEPLDN